MSGPAMGIDGMGSRPCGSSWHAAVRVTTARAGRLLWPSTYVRLQAQKREPTTLHARSPLSSSIESSVPSLRHRHDHEAVRLLDGDAVRGQYGVAGATGSAPSRPITDSTAVGLPR
jgi:hypothetical protein